MTDQNLKEQFRFNLELFINGCDSLEEAGEWDVEEYGEMEAFFQNDILTFILRLMAVDECISDEETDCLNEYFGFEYTREELAEVYRLSADVIGEAFDEQVRSDIKMLSEINGKLTEAFRNILLLICDIIAKSDDDFSFAEEKEIDRIREIISA